MANLFGGGTQKRHHDRKNPGSAEFFKKQRSERNASRPKQRWVEPAIDTGKDTSPSEGYWTRDISAA
jgi:hypothetical protein